MTRDVVRVIGGDTARVRVERQTVEVRHGGVHTRFLRMRREARRARRRRWGRARSLDLHPEALEDLRKSRLDDGTIAEAGLYSSGWGRADSENIFCPF